MTTQLEKIYQSAEKFLYPLSLQKTYNTVIQELLQLTNMEYGAIFLKKAQQLRQVYISSPRLKSAKNPRKEGRTAIAIQKKNPYITHIEVNDYDPLMNRLQIKTIIIIPLVNKNLIVGVINLYSRSFLQASQPLMHHLQIIGSLATLAIWKAKLLEENKKALQARDLFIAAASHELKTPLTTLNIYLQLLKRKIINNEVPPVVWAEIVSSEIIYIITLINDLLNIQQIGKGDFSYHFDTCNLTHILRQAEANFASNFPKHYLVVQNTFGENPLIWADKTRISQVLRNLLSNAAKYSPQGSDIQVTLQSKNNNFEIVIADKGQGIEEEDIERVFDKYYKGTNATEEGMGLGLFLCKTIVEKHHGKISITSAPHKGARVNILLPKL